MSKWAFFFIVLLIVVGLFDQWYGERAVPQHQYVQIASSPANPKPPSCNPGTTCGCEYIFHCIPEVPPFLSAREAIVWRMEVQLRTLQTL